MGRTGSLTPALPGEEGTTRVCRRCLVEKPIEQYSWYRIGEKSRQTQCKACANARAMENYRQNAQRYKDHARAGMARTRKKLAALKSNPCSDCGVSYHPYAMDFDHARGEKVADISYMLRHRFPWWRIEEEIIKCDLVCATCHRLRTLARGQLGGPWYET